MGELEEIKAELRAMKQAMRSGAAHLGMKGDKLIEYFLQLNDKENLLLGQLVKSSADAPLQIAVGGGYPAAPGSQNGTVTVGPPRIMQGPAPAFDRSNLSSVVEHMHVCEADATESGKGLRALSSLAYSGTAAVIADQRALHQVMRLMALHPESEGVQLCACGVICNMAYDTSCALGAIADARILTSLVGCLGRSSKGTVAKATEAIARIVGAGAMDTTVAADLAAAKETACKQLGKLFSAIVLSTDSACGPNIVKICEQLAQNEVVDCPCIAKAAMAASEHVACAPHASCWLEITKCLSGDKAMKSDQQQALVEVGAISRSVGFMAQFHSDASLQLAGIECVSTLVGVLWDALEAFAKAAGAHQIENALKDHIDDPAVQTKGLRALSSGVAWPRDVQVKSGYSWANTVCITKVAMEKHQHDPELQVVALESLAKCLEALPCAQEIKSDGGDELIKNVLAQHTSVARLQTAGKTVLRHLKA